MFKFVTGAACALALAISTGAEAAVVTLTATGVATFGLDQTGVLGPPGLLDGRALTLTLRYDTALAPEGTDGLFASDAAWFDLALSSEDATFAFAEGLDRLASLELIEDGANDQFNLIYQAAGPVGTTDYAQSLSFSLTGAFFSSTATLPLLDGPLVVTAGSAEFSIDDLACPGGSCGSLRRADGGLAITTASAVLQPGAVPEPSAWALMIAGFGLAGARLRARPFPGRPTQVR